MAKQSTKTIKEETIEERISKMLEENNKTLQVIPLPYMDNGSVKFKYQVRVVDLPKDK